jgi:hypothetical protein
MPGIDVPDLTGEPDGGSKGGIPGGAATPMAPVSVQSAQPGSPQKTLQTRWRPESFLDFHRQIAASPTQASRTLDFAIQRAFQNDSQLENMIAATQTGQATVTGSSLSVSTGLASVSQVTASIDQGATAHNFWVSATPSQQPGCIDLYVWQPTAAGNNTPIACTTAVTVRWIARGSLT